MVWGRENYILRGSRPGDLLGSPSPLQLVGCWFDRRVGLLGCEIHWVFITKVTMVVHIVIRRGGRRLRWLQKG